MLILRYREELSQGRVKKGNPHFWMLCTELPACPGERHAECLLTGALTGAGQVWLWNPVTCATGLSRAHHLKRLCNQQRTRGGVGGGRWRGRGGTGKEKPISLSSARQGKGAACKDGPGRMDKKKKSSEERAFGW